MIEPPLWAVEQLEVARRVAIDDFRRSRLEEPIEDYGDAFDEYLGIVEDLLEANEPMRG